MTARASETHASISPDSGLPWHTEGAWRVSDGVHRIPLPLPMDGLKAVNVYVVESEAGLTLIDGGWAIPEARALLQRCLADIGFTFADIRRFMVTHVHRDHYTMARVLGSELGAEVVLGRGDQPGIEAVQTFDVHQENPFSAQLRACGAHELAETWARGRLEDFDAQMWRAPDRWLDGDHTIALGSRTLDAVATPGHTPGHYVFAEQGAGILFAGDHVLPTITPSIGFVVPTEPQPLGDFMASLTKVRALRDLQVLPAHGPVAPSTHARVDALLAHHEARLEQSLDALGDGATTAADVARRLHWTRHERAWQELDSFNQGMAVMETKAHLDLLVARGQASSVAAVEGEVHYTALVR